jgi:hypothetical protein
MFKETLSRVTVDHCEGDRLCLLFDRDRAKLPENYTRTNGDEKHWASIEELERNRRGNIIQDALYRTAMYVCQAFSPLFTHMFLDCIVPLASPALIRTVKAYQSCGITRLQKQGGLLAALAGNTTTI